VPDADPLLVLRGRMTTLATAIAAWSDDLDTCVREDGDPADALLRWNELLSRIRHALAGADRILAYVPAVGVAAAPAPAARLDDGGRQRVLLELWCDRHGLATAWRRVDDPGDLDQDAEHADITTDLAELLATVARTRPVLDRLLAREMPAPWQAEAFYGVLAPWRRSLRHLDDVLGWLRDRLADRPDW
jgi:hypothetical protein